MTFGWLIPMSGIFSSVGRETGIDVRQNENDKTPPDNHPRRKE
jgi:hypothetical protein